MDELLFAFLTTRPEYRDPKRCSRELVGPMREALTLEGNMLLLAEFPEMPSKALNLLKRKSDADDALKEFCDRCGRCKWGKRK